MWKIDIRPRSTWIDHGLQSAGGRGVATTTITENLVNVAESHAEGPKN